MNCIKFANHTQKILKPLAKIIINGAYKLTLSEIRIDITANSMDDMAITLEIVYFSYRDRHTVNVICSHFVHRHLLKWSINMCIYPKPDWKYAFISSVFIIVQNLNEATHCTVIIQIRLSNKC